MKIIDRETGIESITSLIHNAKEFVVIVSPYNDLGGWDRLKDIINEAAKKLKVSYYVRKGEGINGIEGIEATIYEVPLLHAKMFFSEKEAIISSGNLTNRSDINLFCRLEGDEYKQITDFFKRYIKSGAKTFKRGL